MKIKKARIQTFRNHTDSTLDIGEASFVVVKGDNLAGKSSLVQGMSMCLTPSTSGLDAQGRNFERKIKRGETKAVLTLDVQGGRHLVQRTVTLNTNTSGRTTKCVCLDDPDWKPLPFENLLTNFKDALVVALNTDYFVLRMGEKEQKKLLAQLALPERYDFPREKVEGVDRLLGEGAVDFSKEPFAVIESAYKKLFEERTVVNRQVKDYVIPDALPIDPSVDSVGLEEQITTLRAEQKQIEEERDAEVAKWNKVDKQRATLQAKIDTIKQELHARKQKVDAIKLLSADKIKELTAIANNKDKQKELTNEINIETAFVHTKGLEMKRLEELPDAGSTCPTCDQVIDPERLKKMAGDLFEAQEQHKIKLAQLRIDLAGLGDVDGAMKELFDNDGRVKEKQTLEEEIRTRIENGKKIRAELDAIPVETNPQEQFTLKLTGVSQKINDAQAKLRPVIAAEERKKEIAQRTAVLENLKKNAAELDSLVKYFDKGKDGIKAKLLAEYIGGFEGKLNEVLSAWGYTCSLSIDPYEFLVTNARGDTLPVSELSGAEELMFSLALQCAVARAAKIGFIVADRMDTFLPHHRKKANECLYKMVDQNLLDQVILVLADTTTTAPQLPGAAFFFVDNGAVTKL